MAKHLAIYHKENVGGLDSFEYTSVATFKKNLDISEAVSVSLKYFYQDISEEWTSRRCYAQDNNDTGVETWLKNIAPTETISPWHSSS